MHAKFGSDWVIHSRARTYIQNCVLTISNLCARLYSVEWVNKKTIMNFDPGRMSLVVDGTEEIYIKKILVGNFATEIQIQNIMNAERDC